MSHTIKQELRRCLQEKLASVSAEEVAVASGHVLRELQSLLEGRPGVASVLLYQPLVAWKELDLSSLPVLLPSLSFVTLENTKDAVFPQEKFDVIVVPLLGFNYDGYRLGHGGGWYDRFLTAQPNAFKIGVGYEETRIDYIPERHDLPMNVIITEKVTRVY